MSMLEEAVAWQYGAVLTYVQVKNFRREWRVVIKARFSNMMMVSFIHGDTYGAACEFAVSLADQRELVWHRDRKPAWARD